MKVALVHDYVTQRGGAERVVLTMLKAFAGAPLYTSLYEPAATLPEFASADIRCLPLNRSRALRRNHRAALPFLAPAFSRLRVSADVTICSSSGWSHGVQTDGRKLVYCHAPARWLYQADRYLGGSGRSVRLALTTLASPLRRWDRRAAHSADRYLTNSTMMREFIRSIYGIDAEVLPPPHSVDVDGPHQAIEGLEPGYLLCVSRLVPYKNVDAIVRAFGRMPSHQLVVVGSGPEMGRLTNLAGANVRLLGSVPDEQLRWLYANSRGLIAASYEDYGLTPLEAASFGKPVAALRWGGFLDTVVEGRTGVFFDRPDPDAIAGAVMQMLTHNWKEWEVLAQAGRYDETNFMARLRAVASDEARSESDAGRGPVTAVNSEVAPNGAILNAPSRTRTPTYRALMSSSHPRD